ncbi:uncharacterized protein LOC131883670 [Tigriopus californicus]|uniref:uncharacterized protein LOC131883670 n=1 Tax=Tigriopus californicus TaxID=6832 RepID=UPI0027DA6C2B|nr:uncharacterized protein LOC131883670 [Tigriopus californicus]
MSQFTTMMKAKRPCLIGGTFFIGLVSHVLGECIPPNKNYELKFNDYYRYVTEPAFFSDAIELCKRDGGHLGVFQSEDEYKALQFYAKKSDFIHIGIEPVRVAKECLDSACSHVSTTWVDGTPFSFQPSFMTGGMVALGVTVAQSSFVYTGSYKQSQQSRMFISYLNQEYPSVCQFRCRCWANVTVERATQINEVGQGWMDRGKSLR